jgi:hypothetical protein
MTVEELNKILNTAYKARFVLAGDASHWTCTDYEIIKFAAMIADAEREACAKIAEAYEPRCDTCPSGVATAIRARGV